MRLASQYLVCIVLVWCGATGISVRGDGEYWTPSDRDMFLEEHNKVRASVQEPPLEWDDRLEGYARWYADQRNPFCKPPLVHSHGPFGENLFWGGGNQWTVHDIVTTWVEENQNFNTISSKCEPGKVCGHFTQIVWRDTKRLGCVRYQCTNGDIFGICSYDPPGNYIGEIPFEDHHRG